MAKRKLGKWVAAGLAAGTVALAVVSMKEKTPEPVEPAPIEMGDSSKCAQASPEMLRMASRMATTFSVINELEHPERLVVKGEAELVFPDMFSTNEIAELREFLSRGGTPDEYFDMKDAEFGMDDKK